MHNARIDTSKDVEGRAVILASMDLTGDEAAAAAHVVAAVRAERYRNAELSADDVLALRELTALTDQLQHPLGDGVRSLSLSPARLNALRDALDAFVAERDDAEWIREEDREPLASARALLWPLGDLAADAMRAALTTGDGATA